MRHSWMASWKRQGVFSPTCTGCTFNHNTRNSRGGRCGACRMRSPALSRNSIPFPNSKRRRSWGLSCPNCQRNHRLPVCDLVHRRRGAHLQLKEISHVSRIDATTCKRMLILTLSRVSDEEICINVIPNQVLAYQALAMLSRLFRYGRLSHQGGFVNLPHGSHHIPSCGVRRGRLSAPKISLLSSIVSIFNLTSTIIMYSFNLSQIHHKLFIDLQVSGLYWLCHH